MKKLFWGLFFIVAGIFVIVNQMGYYTNISLLNLLFTIFLIPILVTSIFRINFFGVLFSLASLAIIYSGPLHLESITPYPVLLAALFGSIGLSIIFNRHHYWRGNYYHSHHDRHFEEVVNNPDSDEVEFGVSFGSSIKYVNSTDFKRANLNCSFGALKVYFDNAKIRGDSAIINLDISFSGVEIYIPREWEIINNVDTTLSAVETKTFKQTKSEKTITLTGKASLSGVEIIYI